MSREWILALAIALVVVAVTLIPYALGYAFLRPGIESTGIIMNPEDSQSYFAKMLQGYDGNWLYAIPYTTEEHAPAFVGGFYLALGHLARWLGLSLVAMWHLARVVADLILFLTTFGFVATFLRDARARWTAYLLALFGSGLGWLLFLLDQPYWLDFFPVDFKMPESHLFFSALTFPHVALGTALILASFWFLLRAMSACGSWHDALGAGLANLALAIVYPFLIYLIVATAGLYWLYLAARAGRILWRQGLALAIAFLPSAPLITLYANTLATNPVFRAWDAQAITPSPPVPHYLAAYGVMLLLAGCLLVKRERSSSQDDSFAFLWTWVIAVALLVYAPLNPQRRFIEGVHVPLSLLATAGLFQVVLPRIEQTRAFRWLAARPRYSTAGLERLLIVAFLVVMSLSNWYILASVSVTASLQQPFPLFRSHAEVAATEWLREHSPRSAVVFCAYQTGNYVAAHAGNRVVVGHWAETVNWEAKADEVARFYNAATDDAWRREVLAHYRAAYVWLGAEERKLGNFDLSRAGYLEQVYSDSDVTVYRVH